MRLLARLASCVAPVAFLAIAVPAQEPAPAAAPAKTDGTATPIPSGRMEYISLESELLKLTLKVGIYLPPGYDESKARYPTIYFLHGLWGNCHKWEERGTNKTVDGMIADAKLPPTIVVCPDGMNSMYCDALEGDAPWGEFFATELVVAIDAKYRTIPDRAMRGINGDSMGGYGALNIAFKYADVFGSVSAHSAAIYPTDPDKLPARIKEFAPQWKPVYGWPIDVEHWKTWNPLELAADMPVEELKKLAIYFDCGDQDRYGFNKTNEELHQILERRKVPHEWQLRTGGHGRDYFSEYVPFSLAFHGALFAAAAKESPPKH